MNRENRKNDWFGKDPKVRRNATFKFWEMMQSDAVLRAECTDTKDPQAASKAAREALETAGNFDDIPDDVEVRVFENIREPADKLVTILLPEKSVVLDPLTFKSEEIWRCSWNLWAQKRKSANKANRKSPVRIEEP